jgi:hypothetical protein
MNEPKPGDVIRWTRYNNWRGVEVTKHRLEIYRHTLGFFQDEDYREAGIFTPL